MSEKKGKKSYSEVLDFFISKYLPWNSKYKRIFEITDTYTYFYISREDPSKFERTAWNGSKWRNHTKVMAFCESMYDRGQKPPKADFKKPKPEDNKLGFYLVKNGKTISLQGRDRIHESLAVKSLLPVGLHKNTNGTNTFHIKRKIGITKSTWPIHKDHKFNLSELTFFQNAVNETNKKYKDFEIDYMIPPYKGNDNNPTRDSIVIGWDVQVDMPDDFKISEDLAVENYLGAAKILNYRYSKEEKKFESYWEWRFNVHSTKKVFIDVMCSYTHKNWFPALYPSYIRCSNTKLWDDFLSKEATTTALVGLKQKHTQWCYKGKDKTVYIYNSHHGVSFKEDSKDNSCLNTIKSIVEKHGWKLQPHTRHQPLQKHEGSCSAIAFSRVILRLKTNTKSELLTDYLPQDEFWSLWYTKMVYNKYERIASKFNFETPKENFDALQHCQNFWNCYAVPFLSFDKGLLFNNDVAVEICVIMKTTSELFIFWRIRTKVKIETNESLYLVDSSLTGHSADIPNQDYEIENFIKTKFTLQNFLKMVHENNLS